MADQRKADVILYDLACTKGVCFSPSVWRIRLILNYKRIPYRTVFLEFPDIEPTLQELGIVPGKSPSGEPLKYTVPAIHHVPSDKRLMDSATIAPFLESTYPDPPLQLKSELGKKIELESRSVMGLDFRNSIMPRELEILLPRSQAYFRGTREAAFGRPVEDLLPEPSEEDAIWDGLKEKMLAVGELLQTHGTEGPFVLGAKPSYTDFFIAGSLQCARTVDEGVFARIGWCPGFKEVYEACLPWMERKD